MHVGDDDYVGLPASEHLHARAPPEPGRLVAVEQPHLFGHTSWGVVKTAAPRDVRSDRSPPSDLALHIDLMATGPTERGHHLGHVVAHETVPKEEDRRLTVAIDVRLRIGNAPR